MSVMRGIVVATVLACAAILVLGALRPARAQTGTRNHGHAQHHDWYEKLKQPGTSYSCCNGEVRADDGTLIEGDCRPTRALQDPDGTWRALVDGQWRHVPPRVVLKTLAPDGRSHICANRNGMIFCFIGGSPKI